MKILPINNCNYILPNRTKPVTQPLAADTFTKSPAFKGYKLFPFINGNVPYNSNNLQVFNQVLSNIDSSWVEDLIKITLGILQNFKENKDYTFSLDFLIRTAKAEDMKRINTDITSLYLSNVEFAEENTPNVLALLENLKKDTSVIKKDVYFLFDKCFDNENVMLLKTIINNDNWQLLKLNNISGYKFIKEQLPIIRKGQNSKNPEIRKLFDDKNIYNLLKQYSDIYTDCIAGSDSMFDLGLIYLYQTPQHQRSVIAENMVYNILYNVYDNKAELISEIPVTNQEREVLKQQNRKMDVVIDAFALRIKKIVQRNGIETPEQLLACLNDKLMSEDLLIMPYNDITILDKIAEIPVVEENQQIISQIVDKLSEMLVSPDNNYFRRAALIAAKNGNAEILKLFDAKHVHYKNILRNSIDDFPENVREILHNAKINVSILMSYVYYPSGLEGYLNTYPQVDINSRDEHGETLLTRAISTRSLAVLDLLSKRDDVDWNMLNNNGENVLMQLLDDKESSLEFKSQVIKLLKNLGKGKFDINYINERAYSPFTPAHTVLSEHVHYLNSSLLKEILDFPDIDTNLNPRNERPLISHTLNNIDNFKLLFLHPSTDTTMITPEFFRDLDDKNVRYDIRVLNFVNEYLVEHIEEEIKGIYDEKGILDIDDFEKILSIENFKNINMKFNIAGENIGHLLTDYYPNSANSGEVRRIVKILETLDSRGFDFHVKDDFGKTPLDKSKEAENDIVTNLLKRFM